MTDSSISSIMVSLFATILVSVLAWVALRGLKHVHFGKKVPTSPADTLRFVRSLPLGQRERITLVQYRGEYLLLGVTASAITVLRHYPAPDGSAELVDEIQHEVERQDLGQNNRL